MILDNERQRQLLLEIMKNVNFPGAVLEDAYELKSAIARATVKPTLKTVETQPIEPAIGLLAPGQGD